MGVVIEKTNGTTLIYLEIDTVGDGFYKVKRKIGKFP